MSYFTTGAAGSPQHFLAWPLGAGVKITDQLEIQLEVPIAGLVVEGGYDRFGVGNVALGLNYFSALGRALRLKLGGAVAFGPWNDSGGAVTEEGIAVGFAGLATHGYQESWLFTPGRVHLVAPGRLEIGESLQFTGDFFAHLSIPTLDGADAEVFVTAAPGVAFLPHRNWAFGARLPVQVLSLNDALQVDLEPFVRFSFSDSGFVSTRFTIHLDNDLGFSFDSGRMWGWHIAAGTAF